MAVKQNPFSLAPGRYVLCGASGLAGSHALKQMLNQPGVSICAVVNQTPLSVEADNLEIIQADLTDVEHCKNLFQGCDYALIFAGVVASAPVLARDPITAVQTNLKIAVNCLEAAWRNNVRHCVWLSSTTGYPAFEGDIGEEAMFKGEPAGNWFGLGWMTRYVEKFAQHLSENVPNPLSITALRPSMIYGENDHFDDENSHFLPALIRRVVEREKPIEVWGNGQQERDVIHAEDVVHAAFSALQREKGFAAYNIAFGESYSVNHILSLICEIDDYTDAKIVHKLDKPQSLVKRSFSSARASCEIDFKPQVSLEQGLERTIKWYREEKMRQKPEESE